MKVDIKDINFNKQGLGKLINVEALKFRVERQKELLASGEFECPKEAFAKACEECKEQNKIEGDEA